MQKANLDKRFLCILEERVQIQLVTGDLALGLASHFDLYSVDQKLATSSRTVGHGLSPVCEFYVLVLGHLTQTHHGLYGGQPPPPRPA